MYQSDAKRGKVLVTGGSGFLGSAMVRQLIAEGFEVRCFDLPGQILRNPPPPDAEIYRGSILDVNDLSAAIYGCDYVVHFAAMLGVRRTETKRLSCLTVNIQGTVNVLEACIKERVKKVIFPSSSEVYGDAPRTPISEDSPLNPKSVYALTKMIGEEYLKAYKQRYGLEYTILRYFNVYGVGQVAEFVIPRFVKRVLQGKPPVVYGKGNQVRSFCYVDDAIKGTIQAMFSDKAASQVFNIGNDKEPITIKELAYKVISLAGKDMAPEFVVMDESDRSEDREVQRRIPDITKARLVLGYEPSVSLAEGISRVMRSGNIEDGWVDPAERVSAPEVNSG